MLFELKNIFLKFSKPHFNFPRISIIFEHKTFYLLIKVFIYNQKNNKNKIKTSIRARSWYPSPSGQKPDLKELNRLYYVPGCQFWDLRTKLLTSFIPTNIFEEIICEIKCRFLRKSSRNRGSNWETEQKRRNVHIYLNEQANLVKRISSKHNKRIDTTNMKSFCSWYFEQKIIFPFPLIKDLGSSFTLVSFVASWQV